MKASWFLHTTSSPYHSQSNGKAESSVKLAKKLLKRAADSQLAPLEYRNTITASMTLSPYRDCCIDPRGLSYRSWTVVEPMTNQTVLRKRGNSGHSTIITSICVVSPLCEYGHVSSNSHCLRIVHHRYHICRVYAHCGYGHVS